MRALLLLAVLVLGAQPAAADGFTPGNPPPVSLRPPTPLTIVPLPSVTGEAPAVIASPYDRDERERRRRRAAVTTPEPASWAIMAAGLAALLARRRA